MAKMHVKKGDTVLVISGSDRGKLNVGDDERRRGGNPHGERHGEREERSTLEEAHVTRRR